MWTGAFALKCYTFTRHFIQVSHVLNPEYAIFLDLSLILLHKLPGVILFQALPACARPLLGAPPSGHRSLWQGFLLRSMCVRTGRRTSDELNPAGSGGCRTGTEWKKIKHVYFCLPVKPVKCTGMWMEKYCWSCWLKRVPVAVSQFIVIRCLI